MADRSIHGDCDAFAVPCVVEWLISFRPRLRLHLPRVESGLVNVDQGLVSIDKGCEQLSKDLPLLHQLASSSHLLPVDRQACAKPDVVLQVELPERVTADAEPPLTFDELRSFD